MLIPRTAVPNLIFPTLQHGEFDLSKNAKNKFNLIVFYRGLHCPLCANYLTELSNLTEEFKKRDVKIIIISSRDDQTLYYGSTQTMPFARPIFKDLLGAIDFAISKNYPARGEYTGSV